MSNKKQRALLLEFVQGTSLDVVMRLLKFLEEHGYEIRKIKK